MFFKKDLICEFNEQYDNLNEAYLQENMKRYILDPETLLVKKEILEKIFKDNYFYKSQIILMLILKLIQNITLFLIYP